MAILVDLIVDGFGSLLGSLEITGLMLFFVLGLILMYFRLPNGGIVAFMIPFVYEISTNGWLPIWVKALVFIIAGWVLYGLINKLGE